MTNTTLTADTRSAASSMTAATNAAAASATATNAAAASAAAKNLTAATNEQKVAVLKRLRDMLARQREKFQSYLALLEEEEHAIHRGDAESLLAQVEMEKTIIADIHSLRKVIEPLESLYQSAYPLAEETVPRLKATLDRMGEQVAAHNAKNRALLRERMEELRVEIASLRSWPKDRQRFAEAAPRLVDITT